MIVDAISAADSKLRASLAERGAIGAIGAIFDAAPMVFNEVSDLDWDDDSQE